MDAATIGDVDVVSKLISDGVDMNAILHKVLAMVQYYSYVIDL